MQELCGYETVIRGQSPFCHLFTSEEWISFEYYFDIKYHFELGYGNDFSAYIGMPFIKAINQLFQKPFSTKQNLYLNIAHREMIPIVLVSLGLFNSSEQRSFPFNQINPNRLWKSSQIIPFLARVAFERLKCSSNAYNGSFVRIILNSSPQPLKECSSGPGFSCPLEDFHQYIEQRSKLYKHFSKVCQIHNYTIDHFTFFQE